jgi:hypothetical protein
VEDDAGIEGEEALGGGEERVDIDLLIQGCSTTSWENRTSSVRGRRYRRVCRPRTPLRAVKILARSMRRRARVELSGGRARPRSLKTSTS